MGESCAMLEAGERVAEHGAFGVASMLCEALKSKMANGNFAVERSGDGGKVVTTAPIGMLVLFIAQSWADGWLQAYRQFKD